MEQWRAQFPFTGGDALWTYNSLGPVAASWHIIDWFGQPQIPFYAAKRAHEPVHVMADTGFFSWGPGDTFRAAVFAVNDRDLPLKNARIRARIFDHQMRPAREQSWTLEVPSSGYRSASREIQWPIPSDMPEGYFFLELTLWDAQGTQLSRRAYWLRVLRMLADPAARKQWQSAPVAEPLNQMGPWLRPQVEQLRTSLRSSVALVRHKKAEAEVAVSVRNTGSVPAYAVRIEVIPDVYSSLWTDNFFWLAPGETASVGGAVRLDMSGLDPLTRPQVASPADLTIRASAWNAEASEMRVPGRASSRISEK
jgi:hypothetical protein